MRGTSGRSRDGHPDPAEDEGGRDEGLLPLAAKVADTMAEGGLTLEQVARRSGLSIATISAIRAGQRGKRPRETTLIRLARGLDLPPQELFDAAGREYVEEMSEEQQRLLLSLLRQLSVEDRYVAEQLLRQLLRASVMKRSRH